MLKPWQDLCAQIQDTRCVFSCTEWIQDKLRLVLQNGLLLYKLCHKPHVHENPCASGTTELLVMPAEWTTFVQILHLLTLIVSADDKMSASKLLFESFKLFSLCSRIFSPTTPNRSAVWQVKQLPWVLTALSSCGVRFVGNKPRSYWAWGGSLEVGRCWSQQEFRKQDVLGQGMVTCGCFFSPFELGFRI